jgi:hypothetical protein
MPSTMRQTADAVIAAFNAMDIDGIVAHRTPDCIREFLPRAMGYSPQDNATYTRSLRELKHIFHNFSLVVDNIVEETDARKMSLCLQAGADTLIGRYENDYVWMWEFNNEGVKIKRSKEFSDTNMSKTFYPKLKEAMKTRAREANEARESEAIEAQERQA